MGGPGKEFSRGHRLGRGASNRTQFCTQGPVGQRPQSHPDTMATCVPRSSEPETQYSSREERSAIADSSGAFCHFMPAYRTPFPALSLIAP